MYSSNNQGSVCSPPDIHLRGNFLFQVKLVCLPFVRTGDSEKRHRDKHQDGDKVKKK